MRIKVPTITETIGSVVFGAIIGFALVTFAAPDFNKPTVSSAYTTFPTEIRDNFSAVAKQDYSGASNIPTGTKRYNTSTKQIEQYNGSTWDAQEIGNLRADAVSAASMVAADTIGSSEIATDAVGAAEISAGAVGSSELASDSATNAKLNITTTTFSPTNGNCGGQTGTSFTSNGTYARLGTGTSGQVIMMNIEAAFTAATNSSPCVSLATLPSTPKNSSTIHSALACNCFDGGPWKSCSGRVEYNAGSPRVYIRSHSTDFSLGNGIEVQCSGWYIIN